MTPAERHRQLEARLLLGRAFGTLEEDAEERLLEEMDSLYWQMSPGAREEADARARRRNQVLVEEASPLVDAPVPAGSQALPRRRLA